MDSLFATKTADKERSNYGWWAYLLFHAAIVASCVIFVQLDLDPKSEEIGEFWGALGPTIQSGPQSLAVLGLFTGLPIPVMPVITWRMWLASRQNSQLAFCPQLIWDWTDAN